MVEKERRRVRAKGRVFKGKKKLREPIEISSRVHASRHKMTVANKKHKADGFDVPPEIFNARKFHQSPQHKDFKARWRVGKPVLYRARDELKVSQRRFVVNSIRM